MSETYTLATGLLEQPMSTRVGACMAPYSGDDIPRSEYKTTTLMKKWLPLGVCQFWVPACCQYTSVKSYIGLYAFNTGGLIYPNLSYCALHQEVTNGSVDREGKFNMGARPLDAMQHMLTYGIPTVEEGLPAFYDRPRPIPSLAQANRKRYVPDEWEHIDNTNQLISAHHGIGYSNIGIEWWQSDANPGPQGFLPVKGTGRKGGHSVVGCGFIFNYPLSPSGCGILFQNHHGDEKTQAGGKNEFGGATCPIWGDNGFGVAPIERVERGIEIFGCWWMRSVTLRNEDLAIIKGKPQFNTASPVA